jgi:hypothetical protein
MSEMKESIITVYVDTQGIILLDKKSSQEEIMKHILIGDNHNDQPKKDKFTSNIREKTKLAWVGAVIQILDSDQDFVIIKKIIVKKKNSMIKIYDSKRGAGTTHKDGYVGKAKKEAEEEYSIRFLVSSGDEKKLFKIDPKIRVF